MLVEKQYNYLSEIPNFKLPSKVLINKGKVGCGGTTVALTDNRDTIVCVPFVNLIKNKEVYPIFTISKQTVEIRRHLMSRFPANLVPLRISPSANVSAWNW